MQKTTTEDRPSRRGAARRRVRGLLVLGHVLGLASFLGGTAAVVLIVFVSERTDGGAHRAFGFELAYALQRFLLLPGGLAIVVSGVLLSLVGPFGFIKHRWMVAKLVGTVVLTFHSQIQYRPLTGRMLQALHDAAGAVPEGWADQLFHHQRLGVIQIAVLVVLSGLSILKPFGRTRFGRKAPRRAPAP